jgi:hypothetical protein
MYVIAVKGENSTWQLQWRAFERLEGHGGAAEEAQRLNACGCETKVVKLDVEDPIRVATSAPHD